MIRSVIAGLGAISQTHIQAITSCKNASLVGVCDILPEKSQAVPDVPFYEDVERMLDELRPDCLHICLPHHLHIPMAHLAARKHVNVFLEKPPALSAAELRAALDLEERYQVKIGVCLQNRYNASTQSALEIIRGGTLGAVVGCKAVVTWNRPLSYYHSSPWRGRLTEAGSGVMLNQAIHTMDLMTLFCGNARAINGRIMNLKHPGIEVEDTTVAQIWFESGVEGVFCGTVNHSCDSSVELELVFEHGLLRIKDECLWAGDEHTWKLIAEDDKPTSGKSYYGAGHPEAIARFYDVLEGNSADYISLSDALPVMSVVEGIITSSSAGGTVELKN